MNAIKQFIAEHLLINTEIFEMAKSLRDYKDLIEDMINPIIAYILLVLKARQENSTEYIVHWKKEIKGFLMNFYRVKLKTKDTYESRYNHVYNKICDELELDTIDNLVYICYNKITQEGYDLDNKNILNEFEIITKEIQEKYLEEIIDIIASRDIDKINNFINKL